MVSYTYSEWQQILSKALYEAPLQEDWHKLILMIRRNGLFALSSTDLHEASSLLLYENNLKLKNSTKFVLERLQNSGIQPPYPIYVGIELINVWDKPSDSSKDIARNAANLIFEFISHLDEINELKEHPNRTLFKHHCSTIQKKCHEIIFGRIPIQGPSKFLLDYSLLPETGIPDELIFLRVVQSCEVIFGTAQTLAERALQAIYYSDAVEMMIHLHWTSTLTRLLPFILGLLAPMTVENWHKIRPFIVDPSAIQSHNFHLLVSRLNECGRILKHPQYLPNQESYLPICQTLLSEAKSNIQKWDNGHTAIASKYSNADKSNQPEGVKWLQTRVKPFSSESEGTSDLS